MVLSFATGGKSLEKEVGDRVDERIMEEVRKWWQRRKELVYSGITWLQ